MKQAIITVGLGFGDEGKGVSAARLCKQYGADLIIRYSGGSQCAHTVQADDGRRHTFAQFGSGTLGGVPTYLAPHVIVNPPALLREAEQLKTVGVTFPFDYVEVDVNCLVTTFYHQELNRLKEILRGKRRHGSCGQGIGETRSYWLKYGDDAVTVRDICGDARRLIRKLELLRQRTLGEMESTRSRCLDVPLPEDYDQPLPAPAGLARSLIQDMVRVRVCDYVPGADTVVFEGAQGTLLDEWYGFHPYTTWSTVTAHPALELAAGEAADRVAVVGVTRAFTTRHGAGPLPTEDADLTARLVDEGNPDNPWQGPIRTGWFDTALFLYAVAVNGQLDGIALTWLDKFEEMGGRCGWYEWLPNPSPVPSLTRQSKLCQRLERAEPTIGHAFPGFDPVSQPGTSGTVGELKHWVGKSAPVVMLGYGPAMSQCELAPVTFRRRK